MVVAGFELSFVFKRCFQSLSLRLSKSEEENNKLKATISSLNKEVFKISQTIKVSGQRNVHLLSRLEIKPNAMPNQSCHGGVIEFSLPLPWVLI